VDTVYVRRCGLSLRTEYRGLSVGLSVTLVSPAKTAEVIEMLFGLRTRVGPGNHVLDGGPGPPWEWAILRGERGVKYRDIVVICAKNG